MPTLDWLRKEFHYGYRSGNVLSIFPNRQRWKEERIIGGSYRNVFMKAAVPYLKPDSKVLELGPGAGSWSRAILKSIPDGKLTTLDFQDVRPWLKPERYKTRLECIQVNDNSFQSVPDNCFDLFWSFGVLCHNNVSSIAEVLKNSFAKVKNGGYAVHQYGDWDKLEKWGWAKGNVPAAFRNMPDDEIWWPRNDQRTMSNIAADAGWEVVSPDLGLVKRDSIIVLRANK
jgi:SAM-dependent methyltransferase